MTVRNRDAIEERDNGKRWKLLQNKLYNAKLT